MKKLYFLSGLARSGSTLLGSILNKHPEIFVSPTSPLHDLICLQDEAFSNLQAQYTFDKEIISHNVITQLVKSFYQHVDKPYIFDKHRGWPRNLAVADQISPGIKGIITYRPTAEIITSFIKLFNKDPDNFIDRQLIIDRRPVNNRNRADYLWRFYMNDPHTSTLHGLAYHRDKLLTISYNEIVTDTSNVLAKIGTFFDINGLENISLDNIENTCAESKDQAWGVKDLHTIRPVIQKTSDDPIKYLGQELVDYYSQFDINP